MATASVIAQQHGNEQRENARAAFVAAQKWQDAASTPFVADASRRRYWRLSRPDGTSCILMDMPPHPEENFEGYCAVGRALLAMGLSAPRMIAIDTDNQFSLIEDFGDDTFTHLFNTGHDPAPLYKAAVTAMVQMQQNKQHIALDLPLYDHAILLDEILRFAEWYIPLYTAAPLAAGVRDEFTNLANTMLASLPPMPPVLCLRDFHVDNLMWLPTREGAARCGLLDYQDARMGSPAYDLVSLIDDARRDIDPKLAADLLAHYQDLQPALDKQAFEIHWHVMAAQRHGRILGQFVRLWLRDNKPHYLQFIPRVQQQFLAHLHHPATRPLYDFMMWHVPHLASHIPSVARDTARQWIRPDFIAP